MLTESAALPPLTTSDHDDPRVVREAALEDYSLHVMPRSWRSGRLSLVGAWWALASAMFWLIFSALVALTVGSVNAIIGIALAVLVFSAINAVFQAYAARTGTTVNLFSRTLFGYWGAIIVPLLFGATAIYYGTFEGSVIAAALHQYFGGPGIKVWYLIVVLYSVPLILGGVRVFLDKFNGILYPFYLVGLVVAVVWTINRYGYDGGWFTQKPPHALVSGPGWLWALTAYMGVFIMMMFTWDYARFGKVADIAFNGKVTFGPVFYFMALMVNALVGIFLVTSIPSKGAVSELSGVLGMVGLMGIVGVGLVWVSQTRINTANYYLASTNVENFFARTFKVKLPRVFWAVLVGAVIYVFMLENVFSFLTTATQYQGVLILGWTAIALTYIGWSRLRRVDPETAEWRPGRVPMFNVGGLAGWGIATGIGLTMINVGSDNGWYRTWAPIVTFVVAAAVYALSLEFARRSWFVMERPNDPRDEVDDVWETRVRCYKCQRSYIAFEMDRDPSHGHDAICASCAQASPHFYRAARAEARACSAGETPAPATRDSSFA